jgi:hypothetical protein
MYVIHAMRYYLYSTVRSPSKSGAVGNVTISATLPNPVYDLRISFQPSEDWRSALPSSQSRPEIGTGILIPAMRCAANPSHVATRAASKQRMRSMPCHAMLTYSCVQYSSIHGWIVFASRDIVRPVRHTVGIPPFSHLTTTQPVLSILYGIFSAAWDVCLAILAQTTGSSSKRCLSNELVLTVCTRGKGRDTVKERRRDHKSR